MGHRVEKERLDTLKGQETNSRRPIIELKSPLTASTEDPLTRYLNSIGAIPLLTREEEIGLMQEIKRGRKERKKPVEVQSREVTEKADKARGRLIESNLRLVVSIANKYSGKGLGLEDLIQEGNEGLIIAVDKVDDTKGIKFGTYATWWIRQRITRAIIEQSPSLRIPEYKVGVIRQMLHGYALLAQEYKREPTNAEIAERLGLEPEEVRELWHYTQTTLSLERQVGDEQGSPTLGSLIADKSPLVDEEVIKSIADGARHRAVVDALSGLSQKEREVIRMYFGLDGRDEFVFREIGDYLGISKEAARQNNEKGIEKLRRNDELRSYYDSEN